MNNFTEEELAFISSSIANYSTPVNENKDKKSKSKKKNKGLPKPFYKRVSTYLAVSLIIPLFITTGFVFVVADIADRGRDFTLPGVVLEHEAFAQGVQTVEIAQDIADNQLMIMGIIITLTIILATLIIIVPRLIEGRKNEQKD